MEKDNEKKKQMLSPEEMMELAVLEEELRVLKQEQGIEEKQGIASKVANAYFGKKEPRKLSVVNKKKYLIFLLLLGWCGGHHFYAKRYSMGLTYLIFFWSGFPLAMAIADWLIWLPKVPDENGNIEI